MSRSKTIDQRLIRHKWVSLQCADKLKPILKGEVTLNHSKIECMKDSYKSCIWKLEINIDKQELPIILKVFKPLRRVRAESVVEKNLYRKARKLLQPFIPVIYMTKKNVNGHDLWVFMEYIEKLHGQIQFHPKYFEKIIPTLAKLHALTMSQAIIPYQKIFGQWLPRYHSKAMIEQRTEWKDQTLYYLNEAVKLPPYKDIVEPYSTLLIRLLRKGPEYFPEVQQAGCCLVHSDLQLTNMVCHNIKRRSWDIKFIDWEGGKIAPCWYDVVSLIGVYLAYKQDWKDQEEAITKRCVYLYANEMNNNGVTFGTDPMKLYQMAYLQRILQRGIYLQLKWAVTGRKEPKLLKVYLDKINDLSKLLNV
jgi:thiamine kinase-like enzyme